MLSNLISNYSYISWYLIPIPGTWSGYLTHFLIMHYIRLFIRGRTNDTPSRSQSLTATCVLSSSLSFRKSIGIALVLLYFAPWFVQKTFSSTRPIRKKLPQSMAIQKYSNFNFGYCIFSVLISSVSSGYQPLQRVTLSLKTSTTFKKNLKFYQLNGILVSVSF